MTGSVITLQQLINAQKDSLSLEEIINGAEWVEIETRLGRKCYSIATINAIITRLLEKEELGEAQIAQSVQNIADKAAQARVDIDALVAEFDTEKDALLVQLQNAIDVALAAGAGAAGWTDTLVQTWSGRTQNDRNKEIVTPEDYGATGFNYEKDTAAFKAMFSNLNSRLFKPDPNKTYYLDQLTFPNKSIWLTNLNCQIKSSNPNQDRLFTIDGYHRLKDLKITLESGATWSVLVGNNWSLTTSNTSNIRIGHLQLDSADYISNYTNDTPSAFTFGYGKSIGIAKITINNFGRSGNIFNCDAVSLGYANCSNFFRAIQTSLNKNIYFSGGTFNAKIGEVAKAGSNAYLSRGDNNGIFGDFKIYDTAEHGIRITGKGGDATELSIHKANLSFGNILIVRPGRCGLKIHDGTSSYKVIDDVTINSLTVIDAAYEIYNENAIINDQTDGSNHFALNIQTSTNITINSFRAYKERAQFCGTNSMLFRNCGSININNIDVADSYKQAIFINFNSEVMSVDSLKNWNINGKIRNCGLATTSPAIVLFTIVNINDVRFNLDVYNCPRVVEFADTGTNAGLLYFDGSYTCTQGTVTLGNSPTGKYRFNMQPHVFDANTLAFRYPVGSTLLASTNASLVPQLNTDCHVYIARSSNNQRCTATNTEGTTSENAGTKMVGTWRAMGAFNDSTSVLVQRIN